MPSLVERFCIVCGIGSHRVGWKDNNNPACDSHTSEEIAQAKAKNGPQVVREQPKPTPAPAAPQPANVAGTVTSNDPTTKPVDPTTTGGVA